MSSEITPDAGQASGQTTGYLRVGWPKHGLLEVPWKRPWPPPELVVVIRTAASRTRPGPESAVPGGEHHELPTDAYGAVAVVAV